MQFSHGSRWKQTVLKFSFIDVLVDFWDIICLSRMVRRHLFFEAYFRSKKKKKKAWQTDTIVH